MDLGVLPIKFLAHFKSHYGDIDSRGPIDWDKAYRDLENYGDKSLPIFALEEGIIKFLSYNSLTASLGSIKLKE